MPSFYFELPGLAPHINGFLLQSNAGSGLDRQPNDNLLTSGNPG